MAILGFLFSFNGRIGRLAYGIGTSVPMMAATALLLLFVDFSAVGTSMQAGQMPEISRSAILFGGAFIIVSFISCAALGAKRFHDLDQSGWMMLAPMGLYALAMVAMTISMPLGFIATFASYLYSGWQMLRLVCFQGTPGVNSFGPPPQIMKTIAGAKGEVAEVEPDWVASAIKKTTAKAQAASSATSATPVTRVARTPKLPVGGAASGMAAPAGFGRRTR
jgi:uncharacterized membrane protein YhaH (DUF805 family)